MTPPTNREIDARVAEQVMGWKRVKHPLRVGNGQYALSHDGEIIIQSHYQSLVVDTFSPSSSIADAFSVVEKMREMGFGFSCHTVPRFSSVMAGWSVGFNYGVYIPTLKYGTWENADTLPLAICLCAIKATEKDEQV